MANFLSSPAGIDFDNVNPTSVRIRWLQVEGATEYHIRGGGSTDIRIVGAPTLFTIVRGLRPSRNHTFEIRAASGSLRSDWIPITVRTSELTPVVSRERASVIDIIDADRQSVQMTLTDVDGESVDVTLRVWWSPSDAGWWGSLEVPTNTYVVRSRSLSLNVGLLDDLPGILNGNIVMRSTQEGGTEEPDRQSFVNRTHQLRWELN